MFQIEVFNAHQSLLGPSKNTSLKILLQKYMLNKNEGNI